MSPVADGRTAALRLLRRAAAACCPRGNGRAPLETGGRPPGERQRFERQKRGLRSCAKPAPNGRGPNASFSRAGGPLRAAEPRPNAVRGGDSRAARAEAFAGKKNEKGESAAAGNEGEETTLLGQRVPRFKYGVQLDLKEFEGKEPEEIADALLKKRMLTAGGKIRNVSSIEAPRDPFDLSFLTERLILDGRYPEAELLVKSARVDAQNVVSWNILIRASAKLGKMRACLKTYSDMRSRGIIPNGPTFNHLLVACANSDAPKAVEEAEKIYSKIGLAMRAHLERGQAYGKTIQVDAGREGPLLRELRKAKKKGQLAAKPTDPQADCVGPTVFHANTLLKVCAKHNRIDRLLYFYVELAAGRLGNTEYETDEVAASYPAPPGWYEPPKPDQSTYVIVLAALQRHCKRHPEYVKVMEEIEEEGKTGRKIFVGHAPRTGGGLVFGE